MFADTTTRTMYFFTAADIYAFAYHLDIAARLDSREIDLGFQEFQVGYIRTDGGTLWMSDDFDSTPIRAWDIETRTFLPHLTIPLPDDNDQVDGIWSDGETVWVADTNDDKIYAYRAYPEGAYSGLPGVPQATMSVVGIGTHSAAVYVDLDLALLPESRHRFLAQSSRHKLTLSCKETSTNVGFSYTVPIGPIDNGPIDTQAKLHRREFRIQHLSPGREYRCDVTLNYRHKLTLSDQSQTTFTARR